MIYPYNISEADRPAFWKAFNGKRLRYVPAVQKIVSRTLKSQQRRAADEILKVQTPEEAALAAGREIDRRKNMIEAMLLSSYLLVSIPFAANAFDAVQKSMKANRQQRDAWYKRVRDYMEENGAGKVVQITETTKKRIASVIEEYISQGKGIAEIARAIRNDSEEITRARSLVIARTETIGASNFGSIMGAESTGLELWKEWIATRDERVRDDHLIADGQRVDLHAEFNIGGEALEFPGDPNGSAEQIISCRCTQGFVPK